LGGVGNVLVENDSTVVIQNACLILPPF